MKPIGNHSPALNRCFLTIFQQIKHGKSSDEVAHQTRSAGAGGRIAIRATNCRPNGILAVEMGVSRPVLREAIETLETRKILQRRQGDGTFVCDIIGQVFSDPIASLLPKHRKATIDYLEYRREIEGVAAGFAAQRATRFDIDMLEKCVERMKTAHDSKTSRKRRWLMWSFTR